MNRQDEAVQILFSISFVTVQSVFYAQFQDLAILPNLERRSISTWVQ
jgi:hypothetical protein